MPPAIAAAGIAGAATIGGAVIGAKSASAGRRSAAAERQRVEDLFMMVELPKIEDQVLQLREMAKVRPLTVEEEQALQQGETLLAKVETDPQFKEAQMRALKNLEQIGEGGGLTAEDKFRLEQTRQATGKQARGAREAVMQKAAERGALTGGAAITQQLMAEQEAADTASMEGLGVNALAQQRALDAISRAGELGGEMRKQEYGEKASAARAQDAINRFNVAQAQDVQQRNIGRKAESDIFNIQNEMKRDIMNVGIKNYEQQYNKGLEQQRFENELARTQGATGQAGARAAAAERAGQAQAGMWGGIAQAAGQVGSTVAGHFLGGNKSQDVYQGTQVKDESGNWKDTGW